MEVQVPCVSKTRREHDHDLRHADLGEVAAPVVYSVQVALRSY